MTPEPKYSVSQLGILCGLLAIHIQGEIKPAKFVYDPKKNVSVCSTGDVRTAGYTGYGASFEFPGKTFTMPASIHLGFGALRLTNGEGKEHDKEVLHWDGVNQISISVGDKSLTFKAVHGFKTSTNPMVTTFLGGGIEESLEIDASPGDFKELTSGNAIKVHLGKDVQEIKGKSLVPLKRLELALSTGQT